MCLRRELLDATVAFVRYVDKALVVDGEDVYLYPIGAAAQNLNRRVFCAGRGAGAKQDDEGREGDFQMIGIHGCGRRKDCAR